MDHPTIPSRHPGVDSLEVAVLATGAITLARLDGELDAATAPVLVERLEPAVRAGATSVVLDCGPLRFCDSSGLRALVILRRMLPEAGTLSLVRTSAMLRRILHVTGLEQAFELD
jgi:anti-sigma B factor antagonist